MTEVIAAVRCYNIQVDNPCVFLSQEKVASFAQQTPLQLLKNTERVGGLLLLNCMGAGR